MTESYQPRRSGPRWVLSDEGVALAGPNDSARVPWDDITEVEAADCSLTITVGRERLVLGQRWTGKVPPSRFIAAVSAYLPKRLRTTEATSALLCVWGWARSSELGAAKACVRCGSKLLVVREELLKGTFADVEAVLRDVDRRVCSSCGAGYPTDEEQIGQGDLLFEVSQQWPKDDIDWRAGLTVELRPKGFFRGKQGLLQVRLLGSDQKRPAPGDIHLAVLNAVCDELPPT